MVCDLILGANKISNQVNNWHVSDEPSLLEYRYICFQTGNMARDLITFRDPKRINWESYKLGQESKLEGYSI